MRIICATVAAILCFCVSPAPAAAQAPAIEICFVLDTTGSMSALVDGAKKKIWAIANAVARLEPRPELSFCLMGFRDRGDAYVTRLTPMTRDMDGIYADLTAFRAGGGGDAPEAVGQALLETIRDGGWSNGEAPIRVIYLTGDAPPHTDYTDEPPLEEILALANMRGIVVNAIQCGHNPNTEKYWRQIAAAAAGQHARVAQTGNVKPVSTPLDQDFVALQRKLADTVLVWGADERRTKISATAERVAAADATVVADRLSFYSRIGTVIAGEGDLIADLKSGRVRLTELAAHELPPALRDLSPAARVARLAEIAADRALFERVIADLIEERNTWLEIHHPAEDASFDRAVIEQIKSLAAARGFGLE